MKKLVAVAAIALLTACGTDSPPASGTASAPAGQAAADTGVAQCRKLADPSDDKPGVPTEADFAAARAAWEGSSHDDLEKAGLGHIAVVEEFYAGSKNMGEVMLRRGILEDTCSKYGVVFAPPTAPSFEAPPG